MSKRIPHPAADAAIPPQFVPDNLVDSVRQKLGQINDAFTRVLDNLREDSMDKVTWQYVLSQLRYARGRLERAEGHAQSAWMQCPEIAGDDDADDGPNTPTFLPNVPAQDGTEGGAA